MRFLYVLNLIRSFSHLNLTFFMVILEFVDFATPNLRQWLLQKKTYLAEFSKAAAFLT